MTVQAEAAGGSHTVYQPVRMTGLTHRLVRFKSVEATAMTFPAADVLHKDMPRVPIRNPQGEGALGSVLRVATDADLPWFFTAMVLIDPCRVACHEGDEHAVFLNEIEFMAILADDLRMLAVGPRPISVLHQMTERTEIGVCFRICVVTLSDDDGKDADHKRQHDDTGLALHDCQPPQRESRRRTSRYRSGQGVVNNI